VYKRLKIHTLRGGPEALAYEDAPRPEPGDGEVLVQVHATAVTPTEFQWAPTWTTRSGEARPFPLILGHEFSGVVAEVGRGVTAPARGEAVYGLNDWFRDGAQAEYCVARADEVTAKPSSVDHAHAAAVPISALTAWQGLFDHAHLAVGERVLVQGAAGGVGLFAVQLARWRGARVIGTASAHNRDFVRGLGADEVIDHRVTRFEDAVRDLDVVFDTVGGETLERSWSVLKPGGRLVTIATSEAGAGAPRTRTAFFIVQANREQLGKIARLIDEGQLRPVVDAVFPLAKPRRAYERRATRGKIVLSVTS
jgi:NADPH:quinone reductase-like Zn-dependent oxidoreductase